MFVIHDNKVYLLKEDKLVGVEIYSDKIIEIEDTEIKREKDMVIKTKKEIFAKRHITEETPYIFPVEKKEVKADKPKEDVPQEGKKTRGRPAQRSKK